MKKMGGCHLQGHIKDPNNTRVEQISRRQRRMEASSKECQGPEGVAVPWMDGWVDG